MEFGRTTANVPLGPFLGGMVPLAAARACSLKFRVSGRLGFKRRRGYLGSCALTLLGLAKGVTPVVSVTGKRGEGARGVARALWWAAPAFVAARPGVVLGGAFIPTNRYDPIGQAQEGQGTTAQIPPSS